MALIDTLKHSTNYFSASLATKALGFISIPVLTYLLTTEEYGVYNVFLSYVGIFVIILTLNSHTAISRYWYEQKDDFNSFFGTSVILASSILFISIVVFTIFSDAVSNLLEMPRKLVLLMIPYVVIQLASLIFRQIFVAQRRSKLVATIEVLKAYIGFALGIGLLILYKEQKYFAVILGQLVIGGLLSIVMIYYLKPFFKTALSKKHLTFILKYSLPRLPHALSGIILAQFDRIMIKGYTGSEDAGLYSLAYNIGMLLSIVVIALLQAWTPDFYDDMKVKNFKKIDADISKIFRMMLIAAMFLMLFGPDLGLLIAHKNYVSALYLIPYVVLGYVFWGIWGFFSRKISYSYKTIWLSVASLSAGVINILLNVWLIPIHGYEVAAYTTIASYFVMAAFGWFITKYVLKLHVPPMFNFAILIIVLIGFFSFSYLLNYYSVSLVYSILIKLVIFSSFSIVVFYKYKNEFNTIFKKYISKK
ncbi:MAG: oligosaccharide flippase family protein [Bacteroidota bacterium]|nr:oligosaccharide flippase family protein [Bacteroidota bacterium]